MIRNVEMVLRTGNVNVILARAVTLFFFVTFTVYLFWLHVHAYAADDFEDDMNVRTQSSRFIIPVRILLHE